MLFKAIADLAQLALFIVGAYLVLGVYVRRRRPRWTERLAKRRVATIGLLTLVVSGIKVTEDVLAKESGPVDEAVLWFVRGAVPAAWTGFFEAITLTGSAMVLVPLALVAALLLWGVRRRSEALLLAASALAAPALVYLIKAAVGRMRPALWETRWYWGSSFPSGHTLSTAAIATASALCVARLWPRWGAAAMWIAIAWTGLVALSRLVLGVHWPSDVLAAICVGACIPLALGLGLDLARPAPAAQGPPPA